MNRLAVAAEIDLPLRERLLRLGQRRARDVHRVRTLANLQLRLIARLIDLRLRRRRVALVGDDGALRLREVGLQVGGVQ